MQNLLLPDIPGSYQQGYAFGTKQRQQREAEQRQNRLTGLASQAYSAPDAQQRDQFVRQAIATDPDAGFALNKNLQADEDRRNTTMVNMAKMLTSAPEQARPAIYHQMVPTLSRFGMQDLPPDYTPETAPTIMGAANSLLQAYGGAQAPEQFTLGPGSKRFDASGRVVAEVPFAPARPTLYTDANGNVSWLSPPTQGNGLQSGIGPDGMPFQIDPSMPPEGREAAMADIANSGGANAYNLPPRVAGNGVVPVPGVRGKPAQQAGNSFRRMSPQEVTAAGYPAGSVVQVDSEGRENVVYQPKEQAAAGSGQANDGLNDRQRVAVQGVQRNLLQYAAALTGRTPEELAGMSSEQIASAVKENSGRFMQGGVARAVNELPWGSTLVQGSNADIASYSQGAGAAWAAYENPTGIITNADRETATLQMPNPLDPPQVQAAKIKNFLDLSGWKGGQSSAAPASGSQGVPQQAIDYLRQNPQLRQQFEQKYGVSADQFLR
ncbi:hypothetical protein GCM10027084_02260 [Pseudoxanthomonas sangjuensis]|uniref:hypothetical protein n=1 Tax=Pseudoxanthomonas sangjuensis TaxID=1503750 RepID=UPI0013909B1C|nr:hypothetical protein [Pseudoxanthomonas sangjuensis]KAF1713889.1 hypothetical protein CSC71_05795 [Pseudoxanthomonas sangjuensis]